jgi:hypothetical protein
MKETDARSVRANDSTGHGPCKLKTTPDVKRLGAQLRARRTQIGRFAWSNRLALSLAAIPFFLHVLAFNRYGFFRDELYFIVCGRHPALGYVDQPPLTPLLAAASQAAGQSLWLLRIIPALFQVGAVIGACALARLLGGGRTAQVFTGLCVGLSPLLLALTGLLETTALEPFFWTAVVYALLRAILRDEPRWLIAAGIAAGAALETKYTIIFLLAGLVACLAVVGPRGVFARVEFWIGAAAATALIVPNVLWQNAHGWPMWEVLRNDAADKNVVLDPGAWMAQQLVIYSPLMAPVWLAGIVALNMWRRTRFLGLAVLSIYTAFLLLHARDYYLAGLYPLLFAAGGTALERVLRVRAVRYTYATLLVATSVFVAPVALPLLDEKTLIAYRSSAEAMLAERPSDESSERYAVGVLPQHFADMHGWGTIVERIAEVEATLSPNDRAQTAIFTQNFGEAAAIDVLGDGRLPVISGHNNYYLWGPHGKHAIFIIVGGRKSDYDRAFRDVRQVATIDNPYARSDQIGVRIFIARDFRPGRIPFWRTVRHYD